MEGKSSSRMVPHPERVQGERRSKPRVDISLPAAVRAHPASGKRFKTGALLANMSANGMFLHIDRNIHVGERIFVFVRLSPDLESGDLRPQIAASGTAVRTEVLPDGSFGIGVKLHHHRFL
jgi:hypothetical protein